MQRRVLWVVGMSAMVVTLAAARDAGWNARMQVLAAAFTSMLPDLVDTNRPVSPAAHQRMVEGADVLVSVARDVELHASRGVDDPIIAILGAELSGNAAAAKRALHEGHDAYARQLLLATTQQCAACHTRTDVGPQNPVLAMRPDVPGLAPMDRALLLTATRQFDHALVVWRGIVSDSAFAAKEPGRWRRAVVNALAIGIRTKGDVRGAQLVLDEIPAKAPPSGISLDELSAWRRALADWKAEREAPGTEEGLHAQAVMLLARADASRARGAGEPGLVEVLRASSALHQQLVVAPNGSRAADAMLLLGRSYRMLIELDDGALGSMYFSACVRARPGTQTAAECFDEYEAAMHAAFTGSAGESIPDDVTAQIEVLRKLARNRR